MAASDDHGSCGRGGLVPGERSASRAMDWTSSGSPSSTRLTRRAAPSLSRKARLIVHATDGSPQSNEAAFGLCRESGVQFAVGPVGTGGEGMAPAILSRGAAFQQSRSSGVNGAQNAHGAVLLLCDRSSRSYRVDR